MAANYPGSMPSTDDSGATHVRAVEEVNAVAVMLGLNPKGASATVQARLDAIEAGSGGGPDTIFAAGNLGTTETINLANGYYDGTLDQASCAITMPTGVTPGTTFRMRLTHGAANRAITHTGTNVDTENGVALVLSNQAGSKDELEYYTWDGTNWTVVVARMDVR